MRGTYPRYEHDLRYRLLAAFLGAFIVTRFGGNDSLAALLLSPSFYIEFGVTFAITLLVIQLVYWATKRLDRQLDWHTRPWLRVLLQAAFGILLPALLTFLLAAFYFSLYQVNILETNYHIYALPFIVALISIFNLYYYIRYLLEERAWLYQKRQEAQPKILQPSALFQNPALPPADTADRAELPHSTFSNNQPEGATLRIPASTENEQEQETTSPVTKSVVMVHTPTKTFAMPVSEIAYFYRDQGRVFLRPHTGNDHILSQSLDAIQEQLDQEQFFRSARFMIVNRSAIEGYRPLNHGKLELMLVPAFKHPVNVSKPQARTFKSWLDR